MSYSNPFEDQDEVKFPCVGCGGSSVKTYVFEEELSMEDFKQKHYINEIDFGTYLRINKLEDDETVRTYYCSECDHHIGYFPNSGCRYMP